MKGLSVTWHRSFSPHHLCRLVRPFAVLGLLFAGLVATAESPTPAVKKPIAFDKDRLFVRYIQDLRPLALDGEERAPFEEVMLHAYQFTPAELLAAARRDISLAELLDEKKEKRDELRFELVRVEGKLKRLKRIPTLAGLEEKAGITELYEAWIFPRGPRATDPVCVIVSQPPAGVTPDDDITPGVPVVACGYYFKVLEYQSNQPNPKDAGRTLFRRAPLLLGRAVEVGKDPVPGNASIGDLATLSLVFGGVVLAALVGLAVWLRRSDGGVRRAARNRLRNPYTPPPDPPGDAPADSPADRT